MQNQAAGIPGKRAPTRKSARTRERLLQAAEELFIERGFDGVSINDVALRARTTKALVFYYFKNKQELFDTVLEGYYKAQTASLVSALGSEGTVRDRTHSGIGAYLDFLEAHPGYPRLIQREICSHSRNLEKIVQYTKPLYLWGREVFGDLLPVSGPWSARHIFLSIFGMIINYYTYSPALEPLWDVNPMESSSLAERREHVHLMVDVILNRLLGEEGALKSDSRE